MFSIHTKRQSRHFQISPVWKVLSKKFHFRDGLVWKVDLTIEIKLRFRISRRGLCLMLAFDRFVNIVFQPLSEAKVLQMHIKLILKYFLHRLTRFIDPGVGKLPYMSCTGMWDPKGYGISAVLVTKLVSIWFIFWSQIGYSFCTQVLNWESFF